jgi:GxxExxY protein
MSYISVDWLFDGKCHCRLISEGVHLDCGYRMDVPVENSVILELKCVEHVLPVHEA